MTSLVAASGPPSAAPTSRGWLCCLIAASLALSACEGREVGLGGSFRLAGGFFVDAAPPDPADGPSVESFETTRNRVPAGDAAVVLRGTAARSASGVIVRHPADRGHWVVPIGAPDPFTPGVLAFDLRGEIDEDAPRGTFELEVRATDAAGRSGPARTLAVEVVDIGEDDSELLVLLTWVGAADLDLRVTDPSGVEIGVRNPNAWAPPPPEASPDPTGWRRGASLQLDAQAGCGPARRALERIRWPEPPAPGRYVVRVDTFSLCDEPLARWRVRVLRRGERIAEAEGIGTPVDTRFPHERGAGVLALDFEVPSP